MRPILHVIGSFDERHGGPIRALADLASTAIGLGQQSEVLSFGELRMQDNPLSITNIHMIPVPIRNSYQYTPYLKPWLRENLKRYRGVVLHGMWMYPTWKCAQMCTAEHIPYACFPHGMLDQFCLNSGGIVKVIKKRIYWQLRERTVIENCRHILFTTPREMASAQATWARAPSQSIVIPYGCASTTSAIPMSHLREESTDTNIALYLGRLHPIKNLELLLESWAAARVGAAWKLVLAGSGNRTYVKTLMKLTERLHLQSQVEFVGHVSGDEKASLLARAKWFLLPSRHENFGVSVIEAINSGCPVALSTEVYVADYFHAKSEILPLTVHAWTEFIAKRMQDDSWRKDLIAEDRTHVMPQFRLDRIARDWVARLNTVFASDAPL